MLGESRALCLQSRKQFMNAERREHPNGCLPKAARTINQIGCRVIVCQSYQRMNVTRIIAQHMDS